MVCASWRLPPLAAAFNSDTASFLEKIKRNGGFDFSKSRHVKRACEMTSADRRLFFFAVVRQIQNFLMYYKFDILQMAIGFFANIAYN